MPAVHHSRLPGGTAALAAASPAAPGASCCFAAATASCCSSRKARRRCRSGGASDGMTWPRVCSRAGSQAGCGGAQAVQGREAEPVLGSGAEHGLAPPLLGGPAHPQPTVSAGTADQHYTPGRSSKGCTSSVPTNSLPPLPPQLLPPAICHSHMVDDQRLLEAVDEQVGQALHRVLAGAREADRSNMRVRMLALQRRGRAHQQRQAVQRASALFLTPAAQLRAHLVSYDVHRGAGAHGAIEALELWVAHPAGKVRGRGGWWRPAGLAPWHGLPLLLGMLHKAGRPRPASGLQAQGPASS